MGNNNRVFEKILISKIYTKCIKLNSKRYGFEEGTGLEYSP